MDYGNATIEQLLDELEFTCQLQATKDSMQSYMQVRAEIIRRTKPAAQPAKETP